MTKDQELINDLLFKGFVEKEKEQHGVKFVVKNINSDDQLKIEHEMSELVGSSAFLIHTYQKKVLSRTLISVGEITFTDLVDTMAWISKQSSAMVSFLVQFQTELERDLSILMGTTSPEVIEDFSETPEPIED